MAPRIAIDIGGTFTDVVLEQDRRQWTAKVLTTPRAPEEGVLTGILAALDRASVAPADIGIVIHGTTLATNALIERKGARTALLTTAGFRDTIELGTESRFEQYDVNLEKPPPLVPRNWRLPVAERTAADGEILRPLEERSVLDAIAIPQVANESKAWQSGFFTATPTPCTSGAYASCCASGVPGLSVVALLRGLAGNA